MSYQNSKTVVAIGKFDGVHLGHRELLITASGLAKNAGLASVCLIITPEGVKTLIPDDERNRLIASLGIDEIRLQKLTEEFMNQSPEDFVENILHKELNCAHAVVGYNFRFAKGRCADADNLKTLCQKCGIDCTIIPEVRCKAGKDYITISSTNIKEAMKNGDIKSAGAILGRPYFIKGVVCSGKKIGRTIDFPTANIVPSERLILPESGVYATVSVIGGKSFKSVTNIGSNPTVNSNGNITVETHIIGYEGDLYGRELTVEFAEKIRDEMRFSSVDELKNQIKKDVKHAMESI